MDLTTFIYDFNLFSTQTAEDIQEGCLIINNGREKKINYGNSVSLYDVVRMFNEAYLSYFEDQDKLKGIISQLGDQSLYAYHSVGEDFTSLCLEVLKPYPSIFDEEYAVISFIKDKGNCYVLANNGRRLFDEKYKSCHVELDEEHISDCLDVVEKNNLFLEGYRDFKNKFVFGNGTTVIFSKIDGELFDELTTFTLTFGNSYMNSTDFIEVKFRLGNDFEILYDDSRVEIRDEEITDIDKKTQIINELLSGLYVSADKLNGLYQSKDKEKVFVKEDK